MAGEVGSRTPVADVEVGQRVEAGLLDPLVVRIDHLEGDVVLGEPTVDGAQVEPLVLVGQEEAVVGHEGA